MIKQKLVSSTPIELIMLEKREQQKTHEWVYQLLRKNVICGKIPPGLPLTIRGLAERLGVSAMPIREALNRLIYCCIVVGIYRRTIKTSRPTSVSNVSPFAGVIARRIYCANVSICGTIPTTNQKMLYPIEPMLDGFFKLKQKSA